MVNPTNLVQSRKSEPRSGMSGPVRKVSAKPLQNARFNLICALQEIRGPLLVAISTLQAQEMQKSRSSQSVKKKASAFA